MRSKVFSLFQRALDHHQAGRLSEAAVQYRKVLSLDPLNADAHGNLAQIALTRGESLLAERHASRAVALAPQSALSRLNLGAALLALGRPQEALQHLQRAVALQPDLHQAHNNLGTALFRLGQISEAVACHEHALRLRPDHAGAHNNLALCLRERQRLCAAVEHLQQAVGYSPDDAEMRCNLAAALVDLGEVAAGLGEYQAALERNPWLWPAWDGRLLALHYADRTTPQQLAAEHDQYGAQADAFARTLSAAGPGPGAAPLSPGPAAPRLRVGYLSADFRDHAVAAFLLPLLSAHDRTRFEIRCYSATRRPDAMTERLFAHADHAEDIADLAPDDLWARLRQQRLHLLVDLSGHTRDNRLPVLARRVAPVQVTYLGYPDVTGLWAMDYRLTDALADPPSAPERPPGQTRRGERLWRLPRGFLCFGAPADAPPVGPLPCVASGVVTFGSFNHRPKLGARAIQRMAEILCAVPGSRLLLKSQCYAEAGPAAAVRRAFAERGVDPERVLPLGLLPAPAHLSLYDQVDIALDTFPYNGTTTTCEALYMGVPVVSVCGAAHAGRVGRSLLEQAGLPELCAADERGYVALAAALAGIGPAAWDRARLAALREGLRPRLLASPLMDAAGHAAAVEAAYGAMWAARDQADETDLPDELVQDGQFRPAPGWDRAADPR